MSSSEFRKACGAFTTGVAIATVTGRDGKPHGLTVNSFTSVSLHPPLVLICIAHKAATHGPFASAASFIINILRDAQEDLSARFASSHSNRFDGVDWRAGANGAPVLAGSLAVLECEMRERIDAGDHTMFLGEVRHAACADQAEASAPLVYFSGKYAKLS
jgi:flavin reductase (DIM6/NTAB) family NADH-FMN oxidoreductase RutF